MIFIWSIILVTSLWVLVKAADYFTDYAEKLGKLLHLSNFIIGVVIVAVGTSLPELATSIMGVRRGEVEMLSGNVIGTIIANLLLGLGLAVLFTRKKAVFNWDIVSNDFPFFAGAIFLLAVTLMDGKFTFVEAILFLVGYVLYLLYAFFIQKEESAVTRQEFRKELKKEVETGIEETQKREKKAGFLATMISENTKTILVLIVSLGIVSFASYYVVEAVINMAVLLGFGASVLAATVVAVGTSLPEILIAISAARRGNFDLALGDIFGSNIFDIFVIYGVAGLMTTLTISPALFSTLIIFLIGTFILLWLVLIDKKITKTEATLFLIIYLFFIGKMFLLF